MIWFFCQERAKVEILASEISSPSIGTEGCWKIKFNKKRERIEKKTSLKSIQNFPKNLDQKGIRMNKIDTEQPDAR